MSDVRRTDRRNEAWLRAEEAHIRANPDRFDEWGDPIRPRRVIAKRDRDRTEDSFNDWDDETRRRGGVLES